MIKKCISGAVPMTEEDINIIAKEISESVKSLSREQILNAEYKEGGFLFRSINTYISMSRSVVSGIEITHPEIINLHLWIIDEQNRVVPEESAKRRDELLKTIRKEQ